VKNRILFDSCVLISASVLVGSKDVGLEIKHHFYDECVELVSYVQKNLAKRIGIVTSTIENEATGVLETVIEGELKQRKIEKEKDFELFSRVLNICDIRMRKIISYLQREPIDPVDVAHKILLIEKMYSDLKEEAKNLPKVALQKKELVPKHYKKTVDWFNVFKKQDEMEHSQILNLLRKDVEFDDMRILAEAYHLQMIYLLSEGKGGHLYIASKDHHFVPVRRRGWTFEGRRITDEIERRFGLICEHPRKVREKFLKR
jgi:hypothetical protein